MSSHIDPVDRLQVQAIAAAARRAGREVLLEDEGLRLLSALGLAVPEHQRVSGSVEAARLELHVFPGERVVLKVLSAEIAHKSELGAVRVVAKETRAICAALAELERDFAALEVEGYLIEDYVEHDSAIGGELLLGARTTTDFGPVVSVGLGGVHAELLSQNLRPGVEAAIFSPTLAGEEKLSSTLEQKALMTLVTGRPRGQEQRLSSVALRALVSRLLEVAAALMPDPIAEIEINPLALTSAGPVALDALVRLGRAAPAAPPPRPLAKLRQLLEPRSVAVVGVSAQVNPGHIIVQNLLREGFDPEQIWIVKPGQERLLGCPCVPDLSALPRPVDLMVLVVAASQVPELVATCVAERKAESLILIPGGLGEVTGSEGMVEQIQGTIASVRASDWGGPVVNGGNCLGVRSVPGRCDTMFIPEYKLPVRTGPSAPLALISQSGALAVARASTLAWLHPRYLISVGNQIDLTVGDYLSHLKDDPELSVFACYVEGFRPGDGQRWLRAADELRVAGKTVILYRAGRSAVGLHAMASHTASIASDYAVTRELAQQAGVVVAESHADFEALTRLACMLHDRPVVGWQLGALSNAGFECVAMADAIRRFTLAELSVETRAQLRQLLLSARLDGVVEVNNPMDLTPIMGDADYATVARAMLEDPGVDVGVVGCVPLSGAIQTLPASQGHDEDLARAGGLVPRLLELWRQTSKPWVMVVDAGRDYDPMADALVRGGVPVFRSADRAVRLLERYCWARRFTCTPK